MALSAAALQEMATDLAGKITHLSLHSDDPGSSGTANTTTAARAAVTCTATGGVITAPEADFTGGAASGACKYVGLWSASTAGTFYGSYPLSGDQAFNAAGEYNVTSVTITGSAS